MGEFNTKNTGSHKWQNPQFSSGKFPSGTNSVMDLNAAIDDLQKSLQGLLHPFRCLMQHAAPGNNNVSALSTERTESMKARNEAENLLEGVLAKIKEPANSSSISNDEVKPWSITPG